MIKIPLIGNAYTLQTTTENSVIENRIVVDHVENITKKSVRIIFHFLEQPHVKHGWNFVNNTYRTSFNGFKSKHQILEL